MGATLGFLCFNFPPAKIFMGDSGALFIGFTLAVLPIISPMNGSGEVSLLSAITVLLIPIYDTFAAIIRRTRSRVSIFTPDKLHLHHKLLALGLSVRSALLVVYCAQAVLCVAAMSNFFLPAAASFAVKIGSWLVFALLFYLVGLVAQKRERADTDDSRDVGNGHDELGRGGHDQKGPKGGSIKTTLVSSAIDSREARRT